MVGLLQRLFSKAEPPKKKTGKTADFFRGFSEKALSGNGGFHGGKVDRINENWRPGTVGPNRMVHMNGKLLRERAWDLYLNNPFAATVIDAMISNVIECGIVPEREEHWERAWKRWGGLTPHSQNDCDLSRDQTIYELQFTWLLEVFVGGGCLTHYVPTNRREQEVPLAIELIGEDQFADEIQSFGRNAKTANPVHNAIEVDQATGRTLAYHVRKHSPNDMENDPLETLRIKAENARYGYHKWKGRAKRGTTKMRPVLTWLWAIGYYTDNELKNSDYKSTWAAMITTHEDSDWSDLADDTNASTVDANGNTIDLREPLSVFRGNPGEGITGIGPNVPQSDSIPWLELMLRIIAVGSGCSYEEAYRDYTKGSWSSVRSAMSSDRKRFRPLQKFVINHFGNPTVSRFDDAAVGNFVEGFPSPSAWLTERDDVWESQEWSTPGWESPNPKDDAAADHQRLEDGTATYQEIMGKRGLSWKKHFAQMEREKATPGYPERAAESTTQTKEPEGADIDGE